MQDDYPANMEASGTLVSSNAHEIDRRLAVIFHRDVVFRGNEEECRKFMKGNLSYSRLILFKPILTMAPRRRMETIIDETDLRELEAPVKRTWSRKKKVVKKPTNGRRKKK